MIGIKTNNSIRPLRGNSVKVDGELHQLKAQDKLLLDEKYYAVGFNTVAPGYQANASDSFDWLPFENGQEPQGTKYYVSPEGAGNKDGSSWQNAHGQEGIVEFLSSLSDSSIVYFMQGDYQTSDSLVLNLNMYGGFSSQNLNWGSRHAYKYPTKLRCPTITLGHLDGFCVYSCDILVSVMQNCLIYKGSIQYKNKVKNCTGLNLSGIPQIPYCSVAAPNWINNDLYLINNRFYNLESNVQVRPPIGSGSGLCSETILANSKGMLDANRNSIMKNCLVIYCSVTGHAVDQDGYGLIVNCTAACNKEPKQIPHQYSCVFSRQLEYGAEVKNCISYNNQGYRRQYLQSDSLVACAGNSWSENYAAVLDNYNQVAKFKDTGIYKTAGYQDVGPCPDPTVDIKGFYDYVHSFGDWRLQKGSLLIGAGISDANVTTDLDGKQRPSPPSIGAYQSSGAQPASPCRSCRLGYKAAPGLGF